MSPVHIKMLLRFDTETKAEKLETLSQVERLWEVMLSGYYAQTTCPPLIDTTVL